MTLSLRPVALATLILSLLAFVLMVQPARAAPTFPTLTGRVVDDAHILSPQVQAELTQELGDLQQRTSRQLIVVTLPSLQGYDIADYGYQLGRAWGIGQKQINNGALFIVAPNEHKVRIEVGYGLEGVLTDALSNVILQREVLPRFRQGDMQGGVVAGTQALVQQLGLDTSTAEQRAAQAEQQQVYQNRSYGHRHGSPLAGLIVFVVLFFVIAGVLRGGGGLGGFFGGMLLGSLLGGGRRYDDDGWGGGGGGGGGFSGGGGGSFGGGGSSGSW